jgi:quinol monooxygenase YgiN
MQMKNLTLFAKITPKPEHFEDAYVALKNILPATRAEKGCQYFTLHEDRDQAGALYLFEAWDDEAALEFHYKQDFVLDVKKSYETWLAKPLEITLMSELA